MISTLTSKTFGFFFVQKFFSPKFDSAENFPSKSFSFSGVLFKLLKIFESIDLRAIQQQSNAYIS